MSPRRTTKKEGIRKPLRQQLASKAARKRYFNEQRKHQDSDSDVNTADSGLEDERIRKPPRQLLARRRIFDEGGPKSSKRKHQDSDTQMEDGPKSSKRKHQDSDTQMEDGPKSSKRKHQDPDSNADTDLELELESEQIRKHPRQQLASKVTTRGLFDEELKDISSRSGKRKHQDSDTESESEAELESEQIRKHPRQQLASKVTTRGLFDEELKDISSRSGKRKHQVSDTESESEAELESEQIQHLVSKAAREALDGSRSGKRKHQDLETKSGSESDSHASKSTKRRLFDYKSKKGRQHQDSDSEQMRTPSKQQSASKATRRLVGNFGKQHHLESSTAKIGQNAQNLFGIPTSPDTVAKRSAESTRLKATTDDSDEGESSLQRPIGLGISGIPTSAALDTVQAGLSEDATFKTPHQKANPSFFDYLKSSSHNLKPVLTDAEYRKQYQLRYHSSPWLSSLVSIADKIKNGVPAKTLSDSDSHQDSGEELKSDLKPHSKDTRAFKQDSALSPSKLSEDASHAPLAPVSRSSSTSTTPRASGTRYSEKETDSFMLDELTRRYEEVKAHLEKLQWKKAMIDDECRSMTLEQTAINLEMEACKKKAFAKGKIFPEIKSVITVESDSDSDLSYSVASSVASSDTLANASSESVPERHNVIAIQSESDSDQETEIALKSYSVASSIASSHTLANASSESAPERHNVIAIQSESDSDQETEIALKSYSVASSIASSDSALEVQSRPVIDFPQSSAPTSIDVEPSLNIMSRTAVHLRASTLANTAYRDDAELKLKLELCQEVVAKLTTFFKCLMTTPEDPNYELVQQYIDDRSEIPGVIFKKLHILGRHIDLFNAGDEPLE